jgi:hypothetical protein
MDKKEFERKFKGVVSNICVVVKLRNATFYADDYFIGGLNNDEVDLCWRGILLGNCKIKSILEVY